jgi:hypothetical protein
MYWDHGSEGINAFLRDHKPHCSDNPYCNAMDLQFTDADEDLLQSAFVKPRRTNERPKPLRIGVHLP